MSRIAAVALAASYLLFPVLFIVLATPPVHPSLSGSAEEQLRQLANATTRWTLVHFGLAAASVFGGLTVFSLGRLIVGRLAGPAAQALSVIGVVSALALAGIFWQEMVAVPTLAKACATVDACLAPENKLFFESFARLGWQEVPYLGWSGIGLTGTLMLLGLLGWRIRVLRIWEALLVAAGSVVIILTAPGLHSDAIFGFIGILLGLGSYTVRRTREIFRAPSA